MGHFLLHFSYVLGPKKGTKTLRETVRGMHISVWWTVPANRFRILLLRLVYKTLRESLRSLVDSACFSGKSREEIHKRDRGLRGGFCNGVNP